MADQSTADKLRLLDSANADPALTHLDFRVLYYLSSAIDRSTGIARRKQKVIAEAVGTKGARGVQKSIDRLVAAGYLEVDSGKSSGHANSYRLAMGGTNASSYPVRTEEQQGTNASSQGYEPPFVHESSLSLSLVESQRESRARANLLPDDFRLDDPTHTWALERLGSNDAVDRSVSRFVNHYRQVTGKQSTSRDWQAKARNWIDDDASKAKPDKSVHAAMGRLVDRVSSFSAPTEGEWRDVLTTYVKLGHWTRHVAQFGPAPTSPDCRVPEQLLLQYGIKKEVAA